MRVLVAEDDESVARFLTQALQEAGCDVETVSDGRSALTEATHSEYDLILLDVMIPELNGLIVTRRIRAEGIQTPILIITARDTLQDKIDGLDSGADDYLVKPFQMGELLARSRALLRRSAASTVPLHVGDLTLDPMTRKAVRAGRPIQLSATEYTLLEYLMRNAGKILTRAALLEHVWHYSLSDNVLDVYISYLRGKIDRGSARPLIRTVRGVGFCISDEDEP